MHSATDGEDVDNYGLGSVALKFLSKLIQTPPVGVFPDGWCQRLLLAHASPAAMHKLPGLSMRLLLHTMAEGTVTP